MHWILIFILVIIVVFSVLTTILAMATAWGIRATYGFVSDVYLNQAYYYLLIAIVIAIISGSIITAIMFGRMMGAHAALHSYNLTREEISQELEYEDRGMSLGLIYIAMALTVFSGMAITILTWLAFVDLNRSVLRNHVTSERNMTIGVGSLGILITLLAIGVILLYSVRRKGPVQNVIKSSGLEYWENQ